MNLQSEIEALLKDPLPGWNLISYNEIVARIMELIKRAEIDKVFEDAKKPQRIAELAGQGYWTFGEQEMLAGKINELVRAHNKQYE